MHIAVTIVLLKLQEHTVGVEKITVILVTLTISFFFQCRITCTIFDIIIYTMRMRFKIVGNLSKLYSR